MEWTGIFVTCRSYKTSFTVGGDKGSLSTISRKCDKVLAHDKYMKYKEKIINDELSRAKDQGQSQIGTDQART